MTREKQGLALVRRDGWRVAREFVGHTGTPYALAYSPDGRYVAASIGHFDAARQPVGDGSVFIWEADSAKLVHHLRGHAQLVTSLAFSPDSRRLVTASHDKTAKVWDLETGKAVQTLEGHGGPLRGVCWAPGGSRVYTASSDRTLKAWDVATGTALRTMEGHYGTVNGVAASADGKWLVSASADRTMRIWDAESGVVRRRLEGNIDVIGAVAISPDGRRLASAGYEKNIKLWDADSGKELLALPTSSTAFDVAFSPDGEILMGCTTDGIVNAWNARPRAEAIVVRGAHDRGAADVAFSPDGKWLASTGNDGTVQVADLTMPTARRLLGKHNDAAPGLVYHPDGNRVFTASLDGTVRVWDVAAAERTAFARCQTRCEISFAGHRPQGARVAAVGNGPAGAMVSVWDADTYEERISFVAGKHVLTCVALNADGTRLAVGGHTDEVSIWDLTTREKVVTVSHPRWVRGVAFNPEGTQPGHRQRPAHGKDLGRGAPARKFGYSKGTLTFALPWHTARTAPVWQRRAATAR